MHSKGMTAGLATLVLSVAVALPAFATEYPDAIEVGPDEQASYWEPVSNSVSLPVDIGALRTRSGRLREMAHTVTITYVINPEGEIREERVVDAKPAGAYADWALSALKASSYVPTGKNPSRRPVRRTHTVTLGAPPRNER